MKILKNWICFGAIFFVGLSFAADDQAGAVTSVPYTPGITMTKSVQAGITPDKAISILKQGSVRFQTGNSLKRNVKNLVTQTALGQYPFASVVACIDSRSSPEIVFDQSIGDLFVARVAGNIVNEDIIGSLEYASKVAGSRLIVVLGHTNCGAIKGACDGIEMGNLTGLLEKIKPAISASKVPGERNSKNYKFVADVTEINVTDAIKIIRQKSPILRDLEAQGKIKIVGAIYDTSTGKINWQ